MKRVILLFFIAFLSLSGFAQDEKKEVPEKAKLVSQSCTQTELFMTLIDLNNNELVILRYSVKPEFKIFPEYVLAQVIRTGIKAEPSSQEFVKGTDAQIKPDSDINSGRDEKR